MGKKFVGLDGLKHFWTKAKTWITGQITAEVTAKIAELVANAPEDLDTLKEISDWITEHANSAAEMNTQIIKNQDDIKLLQNKIVESCPVDVVEDGNMHAVTSNAVAQSLGALRTNFGFKIGKLMIEMISISVNGVKFSSGRVSISNPYNFSAPFTVPPTVILNSQSDEDYGYSTPIGIVRTKSGITTLCLFRDIDGFHDICIKGIAIGV